MRPDHSHTALWAWFGRLLGYWLICLVVAFPAQVALVVWLASTGVPLLLVAAVIAATGLLIVGVADHVIQTLLHDRRKAAERESEACRVELERQQGGHDAA